MYVYLFLLLVPLISPQQGGSKQCYEYEQQPQQQQTTTTLTLLILSNVKYKIASTHKKRRSYCPLLQILQTKNEKQS